MRSRFILFSDKTVLTYFNLFISGYQKQEEKRQETADQAYNLQLPVAFHVITSDPYKLRVDSHTDVAADTVFEVV